MDLNVIERDIQQIDAQPDYENSAADADIVTLIHHCWDLLAEVRRLREAADGMAAFREWWGEGGAAFGKWLADRTPIDSGGE